MTDELRSPLEVIASYDIPTDSLVRATTRAGELYLNQRQFEQAIAEIVGSDIRPAYGNLKESRMYFRYTVQETVRAFLGGEIPDMGNVWEDAQQRAQAFIGANPWSTKDFVSETNGVDEFGSPRLKVDARGNPKMKKGAKKELALSLYIRMNDGTNDRAAIIQALMDDVSMTKAGATTYFHNMKKTYGYKGPKTERKLREKKPVTSAPAAPKKERKGRSGPTKSSIAEQVYLRMKGFPKPDIIAAIVQESGTSPAGANTYYCACKKKHGV